MIYSNKLNIKKRDWIHSIKNVDFLLSLLYNTGDEKKGRGIRKK